MTDKVTLEEQLFGLSASARSATPSTATANAIAENVRVFTKASLWTMSIFTGHTTTDPT
jgi:hypothetical protein